jgi:hypothetical protein
MDAAKVRAAIAALRNEVTTLIGVEVKAGRIRGIGHIAKIDSMVAGIEAKLDKAIEAAKPREKKAKKGKAA